MKPYFRKKDTKQYLPYLSLIIHAHANMFFFDACKTKLKM